VVNDSVYVFTAGGHVFSFNRTTGVQNWESVIADFSGVPEGTPAYGNGKLFIPTSDSRILAFDTLTGKELWNDSVETNSNYDYGPLLTPVLYDSGMVYFGQRFASSPGNWSPGKYYCYTEDGTEVWNRNCTHGNNSYYGSGATVLGDYLIFGGEDGYLTSLYKTNGSLVDEINISAGSIHSTVAYDEESKRLFISTTDGYCISIGVNSDGTFNASSLLKSDAFGIQSISTPAIYNGRVYLGTGTFLASGQLLCLNSMDLSEIWRFGTNGSITASPVISTAYDDGDGEVYIYFTTGTSIGSGRLYCLKDNATNTRMDSEEWYFEPESAKNRQTLQGVALVDGWLYYGNDAGYLFGLTAGSVESDTATLSFDSPSTSVIEGQATEIRIVADVLPDGLSGYNLTVTLDDPSIAEIVGISYPSWVTISENSSLPGSLVYLAALDGEDAVQPGAEGTVLSTLTVSGKDMGSTNLSIGINRLDDDEGYHIEPTPATGDVEVILFTLPDQETSPRDLDGDGLYEDLTDNGEFSFVDVVAYFHNIDWIDENLPTEYFDFNRNGRIDFDDIVDMFQMLE
jgi:outer membrane protein assembly factor BamB